MDRRSFLTFVAAAPIAALAPWPTILEQREFYGTITRFRIKELQRHFNQEQSARIEALISD